MNGNTSKETEGLDPANPPTKSIIKPALCAI